MADEASGGAKQQGGSNSKLVTKAAARSSSERFDELLADLVEDESGGQGRQC